MIVEYNIMSAYLICNWSNRFKHGLFGEFGMVQKNVKNKKTQLLNTNRFVRKCAMNANLRKC